MQNRVVIEDYSAYTPKRRESLATSEIRRVLDSHFDAEAARIRTTFRDFLELKPYLLKIPCRPQAEQPEEPAWINGWLPGADSLALYGFAARNNPRHFMEVGSGNSTKFVRRAIRDHGLQTRITSIDPYPRAEIDALCDQVMRTPLEDLDLQLFDALGENDMLFIDNSHRSFQNSDVTVFFTEILPRLKPGVLVGIHDIFLPFDYPNEWADRFYNEQYLLCCYLLGGMRKLHIELPLVHLYYCTDSMDVLNELWCDERLNGVEPTGVAFWLRTTK
ncbi:class I SAM-dependent methyltransferase [Pseudomonas sp. PDNC002]|uniref:class I SAM-dependent methyltransferase n=1 Tax=Pseudomonas sp. PDNC002 TaxID=2811422 RepID=UPI001962757D|nr:class I SAM-dependent methyltransferase [Pseudomonas sp. PDNC002]QRY80875.1 class I SAM-dependent methyltransferase [Pseudomonas sp. PDNC002]